jgi:3-methyladenine DNA glycosylase/8-oxoguanine DNA glycosylase
MWQDDDEEEGGVGGVGGYYSFPTLTALARASEDDLRALGQRQTQTHRGGAGR